MLCQCLIWLYKHYYFSSNLVYLLKNFLFVIRNFPGAWGKGSFPSGNVPEKVTSWQAAPFEFRIRSVFPYAPTLPLRPFTNARQPLTGWTKGIPRQGLAGETADSLPLFHSSSFALAGLHGAVLRVRKNEQRSLIEDDKTLFSSRHGSRA